MNSLRGTDNQPYIRDVVAQDFDVRVTVLQAFAVEYQMVEGVCEARF